MQPDPRYPEFRVRQQRVFGWLGLAFVLIGAGIAIWGVRELRELARLPESERVGLGDFEAKKKAYGGGLLALWGLGTWGMMRRVRRNEAQPSDGTGYGSRRR